MSLKRFTTLSALLAVALGCASGGASRDDLASRTITVVATTGMIGDAAANIGGDRIEVTSLMGPGVDPHLYKASEGDVRRLAGADLILFNGLHLEAKMAEVLEEMNGRARTEPVAHAIPDELIHRTAEGAPDPHIWFDVTRWSMAVERIRDVLIEIDPTHADGYRARAGTYLGRLRALDASVRDQIAAIPPEQRVLVTAHDAFGYFGDAYGFEVRGLQGISTRTEAGTGDVQELAQFIAARRIPAIFVESSVSPRAIEAVQAAVAARNFRVAIGGQLFSDAMGSPGTPEGTYIGMVAHNVRTIVAALTADGRA